MKNMKNKIKITDVVKVSPRGQIVIPREIRTRLGIFPGKKLLVMTRDEEVLLKRVEEVSVEEISEKISKTAEKNGINVNSLVSEAVKWTRKSK